jgi:predicted alpha/beta-fold hydrolase
MTSRAFGFGTLQNYYDKASSIHRIPHVKTPLFIIMAKDDPIIGEKAIDHETCSKNPYVLLGVTEQGGHIGYFESMFHTR